MTTALLLLIIGTYLFSLLWISIFSFGQAQLAWIYFRNKNQKITPPLAPKEWPSITIQLPIYNEKYVINRLLNAMEALDYPSHLLTIQILDDSTDETTELVEDFIFNQPHLTKQFVHIRRKSRVGYKAGALAHGLTLTSDPFIAIFDADFVPDSDFLMKSIPYFDQPLIGMVQTRWSHLNQKYSLLTQLQAFGLNAHFTVEQSGRNLSGSFINFNGTAGIWRKSCIEEAGGWTDDTLTEDLDLSYRAQLKGWKFKYVESITCPAELPVLVPAIKSQQFRWNKGAAESARKHLQNVVKANLPLRIKIRAILHLLNSSVFVFLFLAAILSIPMLYIKAEYPSLELLFHFGTIFVTGFLAITLFYWISSRAIHKNSGHFGRFFLLFMTFSMGLSLHNSLAIIEGWIGKKSPFIRTPKFNVIDNHHSWRSNTYVLSITKLDPHVWIELILAFYFSFGVIYGLFLSDFGLFIWHLMLAVGFFSLSLLSFKSAGYGAKA